MMAPVMGHGVIAGKKFMQRHRKLQNCQRGYILITLMLVFALIAIGLLAILPNLKHEIQRDNELELQHRGTMYMRAIQHYYKKLGRYPNKIEDLENTNNIRFLRRRYKDPMSRDPKTGKDGDFKLLHVQDVMLNNGPVLGQAAGLTGMAGQNGLSGMAGTQALSALQGATGMQGLSGLQSAIGQMGPLSGLQTGQTGLQTQNISGVSTDSSSSGNSGSDSSNSSGANSSNSSANNSNSSSGSGNGPNGQVFGGGPILGVASVNKKDQSIREFNKKNHYNDWYFIYDPSMDRGGLLVGPWQPLTITGGSNIGQPANGTGTGTGTGQPTSGMGQGLSQPGFGQAPSTGTQSPQQNSNQNSPNN